MTPKIHVYSAPPNGFYVNSFLIEGHEGVIVVDTQFLVSTARELRRSLDMLQKPLAAVIITHPHPDHYNGLPVLLEGLPETPVYATRETLEGIKATQAAKREAWTPVYGKDYPKEDRLPNRLVESDEHLEIAGLELRIVDLGPGESSDTTVLHLPGADALLASDLIYNRCHPWLAESRSDAWLRQIDEVERRFGRVGQVFAGHGPCGDMELLDEQRRYILEFRDVIRRVADHVMLDATSIAAVRSEISADRPNWPLEMLIETNAKAVHAELMRR